MTILDQIIRRTREVVRDRKQKVTLRELEDSPLYSRTRLPFHSALQVPGLSLIAEIKMASPSRGVIREDVDAAAVATEYEESGASAISVLTEPEFFRGSPDHLRAARGATGLPLLRKDFIVDPYQLFEARAWGADAVLLIATVLDRDHLRELLQAADEIGLDHLVEIYRENDLDRIDFDLVRTIGANNRDLDTFEVDVRRAAQVLRSVPEGIVRVAESGIKTVQDLSIAIDGGMDAVLIGESLMSSDSPGQAIRDLMAGIRERHDSTEPGTE